MEFKDKAIYLGKRPVMIVGLAPGRQRKAESTGICWEGNKSADLVKVCIGLRKNIIMTNVLNIYSKEKITPEMLSAGRTRLLAAISLHAPRAIICLGGLAEHAVVSFKLRQKVFALKHPSYVLRFGKDTSWYKKQFSKALDSAFKE